MRVTVLYNEPTIWAAAEEADVLSQVETVAASLQANGYEVDRFSCGLDLQAVADALCADPPDLAFNLVEGLGGHDRLYAAVPALLDALGIPYTGNSAEAIFVTTNKLLAKEKLASAGLPTPAMPARWPEPLGDPQRGLSAFAPGRYILKPVWEHASLGMVDDVVVSAASRKRLLSRLSEMCERTGREFFAEAFIAGRELNISVCDDGSGNPVVLPPAEIDFSAYPRGKPRIVGWAAKWDETSFEFHNSPRRFDFPESDGPLLVEVAQLARACWGLFGLCGYARVDFRIDAAGRPFILEVNTNPCLTGDAGFPAAAEQAGLPFDDAIGRIVAAVPVRRRALAAAAL
ncbi:MAG TPA: D-alanine--D-alanine ligase [Thermoanaerobaculia bacterium]|jgi:D-alanine-D-alanine ligase|nr:D-alanine--D-alanine ligase [Thermoanaerobaculia bacterium]